MVKVSAMKPMPLTMMPTMAPGVSWITFLMGTAGYVGRNEIEGFDVGAGVAVGNTVGEKLGRHVGAEVGVKLKLGKDVGGCDGATVGVLAAMVARARAGCLGGRGEREQPGRRKRLPKRARTPKMAERDDRERDRDARDAQTQTNNHQETTPAPTTRPYGFVNRPSSSNLSLLAEGRKDKMLITAEEEALLCEGSGQQLSKIKDFVQTALVGRVKGDASHYNTIVHQVRTRDDDDMLGTVLVGLGACVSQFTQRCFVPSFSISSSSPTSHIPTRFAPWCVARSGRTCTAI